MAFPLGQPVLKREPSVVARPRPFFDEKRSADRITRRLNVKLMSLCGSGTFVGTAVDLSEGGLFLRVPHASGINVGQRCELKLMNEDGLTPLECLGDDTCYATVVRTSVLGEFDEPMIGAGLRFDQPLFL
ncbi:MAG: PilZ domain-containing protein [Planctomycetota bacterium]|mgnify:CR=1 FL=1